MLNANLFIQLISRENEGIHQIKHTSLEIISPRCTVQNKKQLLYPTLTINQSISKSRPEHKKVSYPNLK